MTHDLDDIAEQLSTYPQSGPNGCIAYIYSAEDADILIAVGGKSIRLSAEAALRMSEDIHHLVTQGTSCASRRSL